MPGVRIVTGTYAGVSREPVPDQESHLYLTMTVSGTSLVRRRDREVVLSDGDAVLMSARDAPFTLTSRDRTVEQKTRLRFSSSSNHWRTKNEEVSICRRHDHSYCDACVG